MAKFSQITEGQWVKGDYQPIATLIPRPWQDLEKMLGATFEDYDTDGLGAAKGGMFSTAGGVQFLIEHLLQAPGPEHATVIHALVDDHATENLEQILAATGIAGGQLNWTNDAVQLQAHEVWRQDDNGGQFLVESCICRADANRRVDQLTARGHKQTYWATLPKQTTAS